MVVLAIEDDNLQKKLRRKRSNSVGIRIGDSENQYNALLFKEVENLIAYFEDSLETSYEYDIANFSDRVFQWHCPNCAELLADVFDSNNKAQVYCPKCGTINNVHRRSRQNHYVEFIFPKYF